MRIELARYDPSKTYTGQKKFDCEHEKINKFVHGSLKPQVRNSQSVAYVLTDADEDDRFVGFFTIAQHSITADKLSSQELGSMPKVVPCTRLIMLGVDKIYKKHKLGLQLMKEALNATKRSAESVGTFGMYLDADPLALHFYKRLGFKILGDDLTPEPSPMFLHIDRFI